MISLLLKSISLTIVFSLLSSCGPTQQRVENRNSASSSLNQLGQAYVKLALSFRQYDEAYVDAYFGPQEWSDESNAKTIDLSQLVLETNELISQLDQVEGVDSSSIVERRAQVLSKRLTSMLLRMEMASGKRLSFDEESAILFDAVAPRFSENTFLGLLTEIETLVPGEGDLAQRIANFKMKFIIPTDKLDSVFQAAINECQRRTLNFIDLPDDEGFSIEYVTDQPWSGYNWYQGNNQSLIQINTDLPIYIERALDLGCHEGYPGHHTYNVLVEQKLVNELGWIEYSLMPLYGPQSLISEGSANYGISLAFPEEQRQVFETQVLFSLAGFDVSDQEAERYYALLDALSSLDYAGNEAARFYLNGEKSRQQTISWLGTYAMSTEERAEQRLRFFDTYRSYVINYNLGRDLVESYISSQSDNEQQRWQVFSQLLSEPMTPENLR